MSYQRPDVIKARMDSAVKDRLNREQCLEILDAPRGASMKAFAKKFKVGLPLVRHVRYACKWMRNADRRPVDL